MAEQDLAVLVTEFRADIKRYEAAMRRQARVTENAAMKTERRFRQMNRRITEGTNQMSRDVRRAIAAIALGVGAREVTKYADTWIDLNNKIKAAGQVAGREGRAVFELQKEAANARSQMEPYVDLYSRILRASEKLADSEEQVAKVTNLTAKAFAAGGASATEQAAGVLQLGQALGSGFLQGDELRSLRENAPLVSKAIADALGVSIGELKALGAEGKITSDVVFQALLKAENQIESAFAVTTPRASDAAVLAFDNLKLRVGEYLQRSGSVADVSQSMAEAINFVADNVDAFAEGLLVASAALAGAFGAQAAIAAVNGLNGIANGAKGAAAAMAILNAASKVMFGPVGIIIGVATAAAGLAYLAIEGGKAQKQLEDARDAAKEAEHELRMLDETLTSDAVPIATSDLNELKEAYYGLAASVATAAEAEKQRRVENALATRQRYADSLRVIEGQLGKRDMRRAGNSGKRRELEEDAENLRAAVDKYDAELTRLGNLKITDLAVTPSGGGSAGSTKSNKDIDALAEAYRDAFESEREQIARIRDERLASIDAAKKSEAEKAALRTQANEIYAKELADIRQAEFEAYGAFLEEEADKAQAVADRVQAEKDLVEDAINARDQAAGRMATIAQREFDARRAQIELEIQDQARKSEALKALAEEEAIFRKEILSDALGTGENSDSEIERIRAREEAKLEVLREYRELQLIDEVEFAEARKELEQRTADEIADIRLQGAALMTAAMEKGFDAASDLAKKFAGEQSGIYKALFVAEKAAALASAYVNMNLAIAKASAAAPPPANIPMIAAAKITGLASIAGIAGSAIAGFRDGAVGIRGPGSGRSDSIPAMISRDESVINAAGSRTNPNVLSAINAGANVEAMLGNLRSQPAFRLGDMQLVVQGDVGSADTLAALTAQLEAYRQSLGDDVRMIMQREKLLTTPRHLR